MKQPWKILGNLDLYVAVCCLAALILITFVGVILRYFFSSPILWQEEVQLGLIIWTVFLGGSAAFRQGSQVAMEVFVDAMPGRARLTAEIGIFIVVTVVLAYFGVKAVELVSQFARTNRSSNILHIPTQYIYWIIPVGCALMILSNSFATWKRLAKLRACTPGAEEDNRGL